MKVVPEIDLLPYRGPTPSAEFSAVIDHQVPAALAPIMVTTISLPSPNPLHCPTMSY
jgi:hypothetical protein